MVLRKATGVRRVASKPVVKKVTPRKAAVSKRTLATKRVSKKVAFPPVRPSKYPTSMSQSQKKRVGGKESHRERVMMRALLRKKGIVDKQAPNEIADMWLEKHGWLHQKGYQPPKNRVSSLARSLGYKRRPTVKQLGL